MSEVYEYLSSGGPTMFALCVLGAVLYFLVAERFLVVGSQIREVERYGRSDDWLDVGGTEIADTRRMGIIRVCIIIAPLLGLLGTINGMIETFESILRGGYITEMSDGIRQALLTTQYGLTIAAPGLLAERILLRRSERLQRLIRAGRLSAKGGDACVEAS